MRKKILIIFPVIMLLGASSLAEATIEPNLSIGAATDKLTYELGEYVTIYITGYNVGSETITLGFSTLSQASYLMDNVYDWFDHHHHYAMPSYRVLEPGEDYTWTLVHNSVDMGYYPLTVGTHSVKGEIVDYGYSAPVEFEVVPEPVVIEAAVDIEPDVLNLKSKGKWISCHIKLPEDHNVADVNSYTVLLQNEVPAEWIWFNEEQNVAMAKFSRSALQEVLADLETPSEVELTVTGYLMDGSYFVGTDTIKVIDKGRLRRRRVNSNSKVEDGIEYYIQTDKSLYRLGEHVEMLYRVTNLGDEDVTFGYFALPVWNFWAEKNGEVIWRAVNLWYGTVTEFTLSPGESREFPAHDHPRIWNMRDKENNLVNVGKYSVIGGLYNGSGSCDYTKVTVPIRIVPKPAHASPKNK